MALQELLNEQDYKINLYLDTTTIYIPSTARMSILYNNGAKKCH